VVNAALPVVYRILHESKVGQNPDWGAAYETNQYVWWLLVPVLCGLANLVPLARENAGSLSPQNRWLPPGWFALWLVGTGMHLYCLGYVYDFKLRDDLLAPGLWMLSWTAWFCLNRMLGMAARRWTLPMLGLPLVLTWFAVSASHQPVFLVLAGLNVAVYGVVFLRRRVELAMHLGLVSLVTFVAALRLPWGNAIVPEFSRGNFVASGLAVYLLTLGTLRRQPRAGLLGGILAGLAIGMVLRGENHLHWALQGGLVYLLVHSLFWTEPEEDGAGVLRGVAAAGWVLHSALWVHWANAGWAPCFTGVIVLGVCLAARCYTGRWGSVVVVWAGALVAATPPAHSAVVQVWTAPTGLLAIIGSFVLLGLGTLGALNRHRWAAE
ncbi:MAG TPA: hypothetical protein VHH73_07800, partial [Verrucomicrobiae bacterium]|nr:hypothetical protein [Verrucomicrobiae bacterium]